MDVGKRIGFVLSWWMWNFLRLSKMVDDVEEEEEEEDAGWV